MRARLCACAPCEPIEKNNYFSPLEATAETQTRREEEIGERERGREKETKEVSAKEETAQHPNCEYGAKTGRKCGESGGPVVRLRAGSG